MKCLWVETLFLFTEPEMVQWVVMICLGNVSRCTLAGRPMGGGGTEMEHRLYFGLVLATWLLL